MLSIKLNKTEYIMVDSRSQWGALGPLTIKVSESPSSLRVNEALGYSELPRINSKPLVQFTGEKLTTIDLGFEFAAGWCNPTKSLQQLQAYKDAKEPLFLVWGSGSFEGYYLIASISSTVLATLDTGEIFAVKVAVQLIETTEKPSPIVEGNDAPFFEVRTA